MRSMCHIRHVAYYASWLYSLQYIQQHLPYFMDFAHYVHFDKEYLASLRLDNFPETDSHSFQDVILPMIGSNWQQGTATGRVIRAPLLIRTGGGGWFDSCWGSKLRYSPGCVSENILEKWTPSHGGWHFVRWIPWTTGGSVYGSRARSAAATPPTTSHSGKSAIIQVAPRGTEVHVHR